MQKSSVIFILFFSTVLLIFNSCKNNNKEEPLPDKAYLAFADTLSHAMENGQSYYFAKCLNEDEMIERAIGTMELQLSDKQELKTGIKKKISLLGDKIAQQIGVDGLFPFLRMEKDSDGVRLLFALHSPSGLNYYDMVVRPLNGKPAICDVYMYASGDMFSSTLREILLTMIKESGKKDLISRIMGSKEMDEKNYEHLQTMKLAMQASKEGNLEQAKSLYASIPDELKKKKFFALMNVMMSANDSSEVYMAAIDNYKNLFPDDASVDLISLDGYFLKNDNKSLQEAVDRLDKKVHDPYLDLYRANSLFNVGENQQAVNYFNRLIKNYKGTMRDNYFSAAALYSLLNKRDSAVWALSSWAKDKKADKKKVAEDFSDWSINPRFSSFIDSKEFRNFAKGD